MSVTLREPRTVSEAYWRLYEDDELPPDEALKRAELVREALDAQKTKLVDLDARLDAMGHKLNTILPFPRNAEEPTVEQEVPETESPAAPPGEARRSAADIVKDLLKDDRPYTGWKEPTPVEATVTTPPDEDLAAFRSQRIAFEHARRTIQKYWPAYWPFAEALLSATGTLRFKNVPAAIAIFGVGDSGVGKNTVFKMFGWELERIILWRDKFSLAALQSHHAEGTGKELSERALFRRAKHKLLVTPELGILFRGRPHILEERFGELAQWLDGEGRISDSGTHGALGEKGDFTFLWGAGSTPFYLDTWRTMAALGTRLLFFEVLKGHYLPDTLFPIALAECHEAVNVFLDVFLPTGSIRSGDWPVIEDVLDRTIQSYAALLALGHGIRSNVRGEADTPFPSPNHFRSRLGLLVRGRAAAHGRMHVVEEDMEMARWITRSSMPGRRGPVLLALFEGKCEVDEIAESTGLSVNTVGSTLKSMVDTEVVDELSSTTGRVGRPAKEYRLNDRLFQRML